MRTFFGLEPEPNTKLAIESWRTKAFPAFDGEVQAANFHITMLFLGEVKNADLEQLETIQIPHFSLSLKAKEVGFFPKPGIGFLAIQPDAGIQNLREQLTGKIPRELKKADKTSFVPHITLYRNLQLPLPAPLLVPDFELQFTQLHLFESKRHRGNVFYQRLRTFS